jgi:hypothetical protein
VIGADGGAALTVASPIDQAAFVTMESEPTCYGCALTLTCPLIPAATRLPAQDFGLGCPASKSALETVTLDGESLARFEDPAGTGGTGAHSGGPYPTIGALAFVAGERPFAAKVSCVTARDERDLCDAVVLDWLRRNGLAAP